MPRMDCAAPPGTEARAMGQFREMLATIQKHLGGLSASSKLLIASLAVIMVMSLGYVAIYSSRSKFVELMPGVPAAEQASAATYLRTVNLPVEVSADGKVMVPAEVQAQARAALGEGGKLPSDKAGMFEQILTKQHWINSREQNERLFLLALQNQLAQDIAQFRGIKSATVILDIPEPAGLGRAVKRATASATVQTRDGTPLPQATVDAIASYIAGSRAGLDLDRVRVIDATTGRQRKAAADGDLSSATYLEHAAKVEAQTHEKISDLLSYINGVIVAVTAQVDVTKVNSQTTSHLPKDKGTLQIERRVNTDETTSTQTSPGAEPGIASNVGMDVNRGTATGSNEKKVKEETDFEVLAGTKTETVVDPKGMPTMLAVSVSVPRSFVAGLLASSAPAGAATAPAGGAAPAGPSEQEINDKFEKDVKPTIEKLLRPHVRAMTVLANGTATDEAMTRMLSEAINVAMIPLDVQAPPSGAATAGLLGGLAGGGTLGLGAGLIDKAVLGVLAVLSIGMMLVLIKKSGKPVELPTAEEIVGVPPALEGAVDLIGEADEAEAAMQGIEVNEDAMQIQQVLEQVGELVNTNPDSAAKLISRWMTPSE